MANTQIFAARAPESLEMLQKHDLPISVQKYIHNWTEKLDPATRKVTPRPFLILTAWETPKPIHFWKGHQKSGRIGVVKIFPQPGGGTVLLLAQKAELTILLFEPVARLFMGSNFKSISLVIHLN